MTDDGRPVGNANAGGGHGTMRRDLGVFGAVMLGLGSIVGTGVFVSIGVAAGVAGPAVVLAIVIAAGVATCNALSSAQLAAAHSVAGGTYEYGYRYLHPAAGFTAGWMFLCAKSASAATAALGFGGYTLHALGVGREIWLVPLAAAAAIAITLLVLSGLRRSSTTNIVIVSVTLLSLMLFVALAAPTAARQGDQALSVTFINGEDSGGVGALLHGAALMFVAFTGYGRIATMGEEVREPRRTIPRAIIVTLIVSALLYIAVGAAAVGAVGADRIAEMTRQTAAPLETVLDDIGRAHFGWVIAVGAITAMLGVLLNLVLGLSRVVLAMGRRGDLPAATAKLSTVHTTPVVAVMLVGAAITGLTLIGSVETTWSFSAFTVLVYYALTNVAAIRLPKSDRLYPRAIPWIGLAACLGLAFWVHPRIWLTGLALIAAGLLWHVIARRIRATTMR